MANIKHQNVLITGGTGLVGSHLVEALIQKQANIIVSSRSLNPRSYFSSQKLNQHVLQVTADLKDSQRIADIITKNRVAYIIHLGAQPIVETAFNNPLETLNTNIMGTVHVLEASRQSPYVKGIIVASSDKAYGKLGVKKYTETHPLKGDHPYEVSKAACDLIAQMYHKTYNLPVVVTRFGNIYGPGDLNFDRLIPKICRASILNKIVRLRSDGTFQRDYLFVKDVVDGYLKILSRFGSIVGECFNFGSNDNFSVLEVIKLAEKVTNKKINYKILNTQKNEIPYQSLQYTKSKRLLGWKPQHKLKSAFKETLTWYQKHF